MKPDAKGGIFMNDVSQPAILIVDDEELLAGSLKKFFTRKGFTVDTASSGNEAIEMFSVSTYQFVISDMRMADGDGSYLTKKIRSISPNTKIIIMTGHSDLNANEILALGASYVVYKPFQKSDLLDKLNEFLAK